MKKQEMRIRVRKAKDHLITYNQTKDDSWVTLAFNILNGVCKETDHVGNIKS